MNGCVFMVCNLERAIFLDASLKSVNFKGSNLSGADFSGANIAGANFIGTEGLTAEQVLEATSIKEAKFDQDLYKGIGEKAPERLVTYEGKNGQTYYRVID